MNQLDIQPSSTDNGLNENGASVPVRNELKSSLELEQRAAVSVVTAIKFAMQLSRIGVMANQKSFFEGDFPFQSDLSERQYFWDPQTGMTSGETVFSSLRDSWGKLEYIPTYPSFAGFNRRFSGLPKVKGVNDPNRGRVIRIEPNFIGGTSFQNQALPESGLSEVMINEDGSILGFGKQGEIRLTDNELRELTELFEDASNKLRQREKIFNEAKSTASTP